MCCFEAAYGNPKKKSSYYTSMCECVKIIRTNGETKKTIEPNECSRRCT